LGFGSFGFAQDKFWVLDLIHYPPFIIHHFLWPMAEWQIIESDDFSATASEESALSRWRRGGVLLTGVAALLLLVTGYMLLRQHHVERQTALREDLSAAIFEEETHHFLGQPPDEALMTVSSPLNWRRAYRRTFTIERGNQTQVEGIEPGRVYLAEINHFDGRCALIRVAAPAGVWLPDTLRAYCLGSRGWQRAPIPAAAWGELQPALNLSNGARLYFRARDQSFAKSLAHDLEDFFLRIDQLPVWSQVAPEVTSFAGLKIVIEPHDLQGPLILSEPARIVVNSPQLVNGQTRPLFETSGVFASGTSLSGEAMVRLALARALLGRTASIQTEPSPALPGAERFVAATQTVAAMRMFLSPEATTALLDAWRARLDGQWVSPFFAGLLPSPQSPPPPQAEAAALLLADYVYRLNGLDALPLMLQLLPEATSWDQVFRTLLRRSTLVLEIETAHYAESDEELITALRQNYSAIIPSLPLTATLRLVDRRSFRERRLFVNLPGRPEPLLVELSPTARIETPAGQSLPTNCLVEGTQLILNGDWLEVPRRLQSSTVVVQDTPLLEIEPAPADTIAYLVLSGSQVEPPISHAAKIYPNTRAYLQPGELSPPPLLATLRADGSLQPLLSLEAELELFPLPVAAGQLPHLLFQLELPGCGRQWFAHYEPVHGITGQWFSPPPGMQWVWRPDQQTLLFFKRDGDQKGYIIYEVDTALSFKAPGLSDAPFWFMGWHIDTGRLVAARFRVGEIELGLLDIEANHISHAVRRLDQRALNPRGLSPDGNWLAYRAGLLSLFGSSNRMDILNIGRQTTTTLIRAEPGHGLGRPIWSPYLAQPALALLAGPVDSSDILRPTRLFLFHPDQPEEASLVVEAARGELLAGPVFCQDGSLLYRVEVNGQYRLQRQQPGESQAQTILTLDQPFRALACF
jgi:hypothetical protein